jgi:hypothetical protein
MELAHCVLVKQSTAAGEFMPLFEYQGRAFTWEEIEPLIAPAFAAGSGAVRPELIRAVEDQGAPDALIDLLDSLNEGRQYRSAEDLRRDLESMGHVSGP